MPKAAGPESERAMEFPAAFEDSIKRFLQYGQCCAETSELFRHLLGFDPIEDELRARLERLRRQQTVLGKLFNEAVQAATEAMKAKEAVMSKLPIEAESRPARAAYPPTPSGNRPPATARCYLCEWAGCGQPISVAQAEASLAQVGNRLCVKCVTLAHEAAGRTLPLEGDGQLSTPEAFR
jgi:hypothetical protein